MLLLIRNLFATRGARVRLHSEFNKYHGIVYTQLHSFSSSTPARSKGVQEKSTSLNLMKSQQELSQIQQQTSVAESNPEEFEATYQQQHYSKKRAMNDVVEQMFFSDHNQTAQYEYLKKISSSHPTKNQNQTKEETDLTQEEQQAGVSGSQFNELMQLSSSAKTAIESGPKRIPESPSDVHAIIENIHTNSHLLLFFIKYQKYFQASQYVTLIKQLKLNIEDIDTIQVHELAKYEKKRKALKKVNPEAKLQHKPEFLNDKETKQHFAYAILIRNLKQKFEYYEINKLTQMMRFIIQFDTNLSGELIQIMINRMVQEQHKLPVYDLVSCFFQLTGQMHAEKVSQTLQNGQKSMMPWLQQEQRNLVEYLLTRNPSEFTQVEINIIVKSQVMYAEVIQQNIVSRLLQKLQYQSARLISSFSTKQLLELVVVSLETKVILEPVFIEIASITLLKNLPQEKKLKARATIKLLSFFVNKKLVYLSDENTEANLEIKGLFEALMSSVVREIGQGTSLKSFDLRLLLESCLANKISKESQYNLIVSEFSKVLSKSPSIGTFSKLFQTLSDLMLIQKEVHYLTGLKLKASLQEDYVTYKTNHKNLIEDLRENKITNILNKSSDSEKQVEELPKKLTQILLGKLQSTIMNLQSYTLNCIRHQVSGEKIDPDIFNSSIVYANSLIKDIDTYLDSDEELLERTYLASIQINAFVEFNLKRTVPALNVQQLIDNVHISLSKRIPYLSTEGYLFELQRKWFEVKFSYLIEKNILQKGMLFDFALKNQSSASVVLINFVNDEDVSSLNESDRGTRFLRDYFNKKLNLDELVLDIRDFKVFLKEQKNEKSLMSNFILQTLEEFAPHALTDVPNEQNLPSSISRKLQEIEGQIQEKWEIYIQELNEQAESKEQGLFNKFKKYSTNQIESEESGEDKGVEESPQENSKKEEKFYEID